jgi:hypothetical protein
MMSIASGNRDRDEGGYIVPRPLLTDAIAGALLRTYAHVSVLPEDMRRCLDRLDSRTR